MKSLRILLAAAVAFSALAACTTPEVKKDKVVVAPPPPPPKVKTADEIFADAVKAFDAKKYDEAEALFSKVLEKAPNNVSALYDLGVIAERKGDIPRAQQQYEAAHKVDPTHEPTLLNLGKIYRLELKLDKATALYEEALKLPGNEYDVQLLNNLTVAYRLAHQYDKAEATVRKLLSRTKDNPDAYKNLALIYFDQGNYRLAEFITGTARKLDDKDPGVYNNLGMIYLKEDQKPLALAQFQKAVQLDPEFTPGHMNIGAMALSYRDYQKAESSFRKVLAHDANSPEAHLYLAYALDGQKGRDPKKGLEAGGEFERYLTIRPDAPEAICGAGWAYTAEKTGFEKAVGYLQKCRTEPQTSPTDQQLIDAKLRSLAAMLKSGQAAAQPAEPKREAPKAAAGGTSVLDQAVKAAEQQEQAAPPAAPAAPAAGQPAQAPAGQAPAGQPQTPPPAGK